MITIREDASVIGVVGLGFVGLTTALGFAQKGFNVYGFDIDMSKCHSLNQGEIAFHEPGLEDALKQNISRNFFVAGDINELVVRSDVIFVCVGTPSLEDGSADLSALLSVIKDIWAIGHGGLKKLIVIKSTIPPGTTDNSIVPLLNGLEHAPYSRHSLAINPEFLREGHCYEDFMYPDRIVCGVEDEWSANLLSRIYAPFLAPIRFVSYGSAEFIKYLSNSLLSTLISFSNEMAQIAQAVGGIDIAASFHALHEDKRLAGAGINHYIYPGCGFGGYCLPKDTVALRAKAREYQTEPRILDAVIALNDKMPGLTAQRIVRLAKSKDANIGILGLSFKPGSNDVRDTPAAKIIKALMALGYDNIYAYDPVAMKEFDKTFGIDITYCDTMAEVCECCGVVALVTVWPEFKDIADEYPGISICDCRYWLNKNNGG